MKKRVFQGKYPIYEFELAKGESRFNSVYEIVAHLKQRVEECPDATFIATFDHGAHTAAMAPEAGHGEVLAASHLIFCFGFTLTTPEVMAVRPRSIAVTELADRYVINFLEAPIPRANATMIEWVGEIASSRQTHLNDLLEEALEETFPASDAIELTPPGPGR